MICDTCEKETTRKIAPRTSEGWNGKFTCPSCYHTTAVVDHKGLGPNLHQKQDGVTVGKTWEIDNRFISRDDGVTVLNRKTGQKAQY